MRFQFECSDLWNKCHIVSILIRTLDSIVSESQYYSSLSRDRGYNPFIIIFTLVLLIIVGSVRSHLDTFNWTSCVQFLNATHQSDLWVRQFLK